MSRRALIFLLFLICSNIYSQQINHHTQTGRGLANSGSAILSMTLEWYNEIPTLYSRIRTLYSNRIWRLQDSYDEIFNILIENDINAEFVHVREICDLIELVYHSNKIVIAFVSIQYIDVIVGRYYGKTHLYEGPHYIILYDFFADTFNTHDPILYGESRLYKIDQVWRSLRENRVIVVEK